MFKVSSPIPALILNSLILNPTTLNIITQMRSPLKTALSRNLTNARGWKTNRKIVVIESDDWGSIRMPSREVFESLKKSGIPVENSPYCKFDNLESNTDMERLLELLAEFKDIRGNHPVITANTVMANPDFHKIEKDNFENYHYENFTKTLEKYPNHDRVLEICKKGINAQIWKPQFHGREHVNVELWMNLLKTNPDFKLAFKHSMWGLSTDVFPNMKSIQATFDSQNHTFLEDSIKTGLDNFKSVFGFESKSFIANNFIWDTDLEKTLAENGVMYLQGMKYQKLSKMDDKQRKMIRHYIGEQNKNQQIYSIRNCSFEPSIDGTDHKKTLKEISNAFYWKKPAIISSHRINFIGSLHPENQKTNALKFRNLLKGIINKWPQVEFMDSVSLGKIIRATK